MDFQVRYGYDVGICNGPCSSCSNRMLRLYCNKYYVLAQDVTVRRESESSYAFGEPSNIDRQFQATDRSLFSYQYKCISMISIIKSIHYYIYCFSLDANDSNNLRRLPATVLPLHVLLEILPAILEILPALLDNLPALLDILTPLLDILTPLLTPLLEILATVLEYLLEPLLGLLG